MATADSKFAVFIRLPFPRGDFVDPPPVEWNAAKDQALWDVLSRLSRGDDTDWKALADSFGVTLQFLLQQAAWLYDRQLTQVRAQMRKVGTAQSSSPSPMLGSTSGSAALDKQGGKGTPVPGGPRLPTRLGAQQKDVPSRNIPRRTSSTTTVNQTKAREPSRNVTPTAESKDQKADGFGRRPSVKGREPPQTAPVRRSPTLEEEELPSSSSSSESESEDEDMDSRRNPRFKRFGKFSMHRPGLRDDDDDDDDDEEDSPAFLPLSRENESHARDNGQDLNATLRLDPDSPGQRRRPDHPQTPRNPVTTESSASSASSGVPVNLPHTGNSRRTSQMTGPLSPRRTAELARSSPRRSVGSGREASDGTPSMGSSFSDLDDASVTQSALEEALLSNMQHGGMASRVSAMSQALRSRYLPGQQ